MGDLATEIFPDRALSDEVLVQEYSAIIQKAGAKEAWAFNFVALYFGFLAALGTGAGYILFQYPMVLSDTVGHSISGRIGNDSLGASSGKLILAALAALGIFLNVWAIYMIEEYKLTASLLNEQMARIESRLYGENAARHGFASRLI